MRQGWPFVRAFSFFADQGDRPIEAVLAEGLGRLGPGQAGPDDHETSASRSSGQHATPPGLRGAVRAPRGTGIEGSGRVRRRKVQVQAGTWKTGAMAERSPWWRGATIYQIYVRSWRDSNGDGIGDLVGICEGLDYLSWLGVDGIWLSPTMPSPNNDWGYDVSDYYGVHPDLGTLGRPRPARLGGGATRHRGHAGPGAQPHLQRPPLVRRRPRGAAGCASRLLRVGRPQGRTAAPPNNWLSATGSSAWSYDKTSGQYYLHNFLRDQPDLNWWDQRVHDEFDRILRYWFDRGIAGFRIDVAHGLYKDALLRDNPPAAPTDHAGHKTCSGCAPFTTPTARKSTRSTGTGAK